VNKLKIIVYILIISTQLTIIFFLYKNLNKKTINNIHVIENKQIQKIKTDSYKYYYDLYPDATGTSTKPWNNEIIQNKYNNDALNDTKNYALNKDSDTFRIVTLGDSFTYGLYVRTEENWTEILENILNKNISKISNNIKKIEVINLAVYAYGPSYSVERFRQKGQKYNPDLIIWLLTDPQRIDEVVSQKNQECLHKFNSKPTAKDLEKCFSNARLESINDFSEQEIIDFQINKIKEIFNYYDHKILFIDYFNDHQEILKNINNQYTFSGIRSKDYLYNKHSDKQITFYPYDYHPNKLGHSLIAQSIYQKILQLNLIPQ
jgi:lysophospholipase L1-like esterase